MYTKLFIVCAIAAIVATLAIFSILYVVPILESYLGDNQLALSQILMLFVIALVIIVWAIIWGTERIIPDDIKVDIAKLLWSIVLILSIAGFAILLFPQIETYLHYDMPFVEINENKFNIFGKDFIGHNQKWGILLLCGIGLMLPGRLISLAILKLSK